jgi:hypothetical protein
MLPGMIARNHGTWRGQKGPSTISQLVTRRDMEFCLRCPYLALSIQCSSLCVTLLCVLAITTDRLVVGNACKLYTIIPYLDQLEPNALICPIFQSTAMVPNPNP